ncbi:pentatricopeptide repeat-containing protein At2g21090-like [Primulina eburnea]|uniref:pentatricopeptide repeat-containing protein At2g21090-like n=1 Tax=Primulina eburnea TaxID=1245227 RepID=UPI003C6C96F1
MPYLSHSPRTLTPSFGKSRKKTRKHPCILQKFLNLTSQGQIREAVHSLPLLARKGFRLNSKIISNLIQQCANSKFGREGRWVHLHLKMTGSKHPGTFLSNHLINMYSKYGDHEMAREVFDKMSMKNLYSWNNMLSGYAKLGMLKPARRLFDKMPVKDFVSWNTVVIAYVQSGQFDEAIKLFLQLRRLDIGFNEYSFAGVVTICVKLRELCLTKQLHSQVLAVGFLSNLVLSSSIIDAYAKCGELGDARKLFDEMIKRDVLAWTTLVSAYAQWGDMDSAREIFARMPEKNSVSWTTLIAGYAQNGMGNEALKVFVDMIKHNVESDQFTFSSCLLACASIISPERGRQIHSHMITSGLRLNVVVVSSLINMYWKCGNLEVAKRVFDSTKNKQNVVLWNTMISALARHGCGKQAIKMFADMARMSVKPDSVTLLALLNACSHSGLVQEGLFLFESMTQEYKVNPNQEHYACVIDLLGRSGCFDELMNQLKKMRCMPDDRVWNALLGVCRIHGNIELGKIAAKHLVQLEPQSPVAYLLLCSMYYAIGRWESAEEVRRLMNMGNIEKDAAVSWIEIDRKMHLDSITNNLHPCEKERTSVLELLDDQTSVYNFER